MSNKIDKPKQTAPQLITKMKSKGITFKYITEEKAAEYLTDKNNYLRTATYRKNYQKYNNGLNIGKYIDLDFSYLQELSTIDMHFRFLVSKMCLDIEHDLKVRMLKDIETDSTTDGYDIVNIFLSHNSYIIGKLEATSASPFTSDLIHKYFTVQQVYNPQKGKKENKITLYDDCPAWVLLEMLTFGDFIKFYQFYYSTRSYSKISFPVINLVKSLRNGAAHNNCILADLAHGTSRPPAEISQAIILCSSILYSVSNPGKFQLTFLTNRIHESISDVLPNSTFIFSIIGYLLKSALKQNVQFLSPAQEYMVSTPKDIP